MITYQTPHLSKSKQDGFYQVMNEARTLFAEQNINILGEGYADIVADDVLFESYKVAMLQGVDAEEMDAMEQLIDNSRVSTLNESVAGITPISSLSVPTLRKLWPRMSMKNVIPTEAVKLPRFSLSYMLPFLLKDGVRHYLPEALMDGGSATSLVEGQPLWRDEIYLADNDYGDGVVDGATKAFSLLETLPAGAVASTGLGDSIDPDFFITTIGVECALSTDATDVEVVEVSGLLIGTGLQGEIFYQVTAAHSAEVDGAGVVSDTLFGKLDRVQGTLQLTSPAGAIKYVKVKGRLSGEMNTHSESVSFEVSTRDVTIGTGVHLNSPLPIEFLQDVQALYNIDGATKSIDIMTNTFALKLDYEVRDFILNAHTRTPKYTAQFDCKPYAQFSGTPKQWREMLKDVIDHQCEQLKQDMMYQGGKFVIVGNPQDTKLIPNINWSFTGSTAERSGVEVDYSVGAVSGEMAYEVVGTSAMPKGALYIIYVSSQDEQMTYKYFPYSFNVEKGTYADPQASYVPSMMMAKRHKLEVFKDSVIRITVLNNNGDVNFV